MAGYVRGAFESVVGNETNSPTLSTKKVFFPVQDFQPAVGPDHLARDDELRNFSVPVSAIPNAFEPSWELRIRAYPDVMGYLLKAALGAPTTTNGDGVITDPDSTTIPTGAYRHVWTSSSEPTGSNPLTSQFDVAYSDQSVYYKQKGSALQTLEIENPETGGSEVTASGPSAYTARQADPSLSPSYESLSIRPFSRSDLSIPTFLSNGGTSHDNLSVRINNPIEPVRSLGIASYYPDTIEKTKDAGEILTVSGTLDQRTLDADDWDALVGATGFAMVIRWVSVSIIASSYPYKLYLSCSNAQFMEGTPESLANRRRHGMGLEWKATSADGTTSPYTVTLVNATSSYA